MSAQPEIWRVCTIEGVFEADLETLRQWILEGCVQPTDKVTKGNLSWIEAGKAPLLRAAFAGERVPVATPATPEPVASFPETSQLRGPRLLLTLQIQNSPRHNTSLTLLRATTSTPTSALTTLTFPPNTFVGVASKGLVTAALVTSRTPRSRFAQVAAICARPMRRSAARLSVSAFRIQVLVLKTSGERCVIPCSTKLPLVLARRYTA